MRAVVNAENDRNVCSFAILDESKMSNGWTTIGRGSDISVGEQVQIPTMVGAICDDTCIEYLFRCGSMTVVGGQIKVRQAKANLSTKDRETGRVIYIDEYELAH